MKLNLKSWKFWAWFVGVLAVIIIAVLIISEQLAPETSTLEIAETTAEATSEVSCLAWQHGSGCLHFPTFSGQSLTGEDITFPDVFNTPYAIVFVVFTREQQEEGDPWLPVITELEQTYSDLSFYDIPLTPDIPAAARLISTAGMRLMIDGDLHDNVVMVYLEDRDLFLDAMDMPDFETSQLFIANTAGEVVWRTDGVFTEEKADLLRQQVVALVGDSSG